jgi:hypothetical protein
MNLFDFVEQNSYGKLMNLFDFVAKEYWRIL